ncbi:hypothetical protein F2Q69_00029224 [Brassica cretica]|uniref:Uncharacterized protein n=1 Tax=Brassica cretica TaxID=69181 RepID=A0A8S9S8R3_BRACR|nr:hypothetical protein F2Q69_00029224 [Brassica cretica]
MCPGHAASQVEPEVPPCMRPEPCGARAATNLNLIGCSVQSIILYDCEAKALSISIHTGQSYSVMVKWRCYPELVQIHGFRSVEVLLDTPPGSPKNCPGASGGSVQISLSKPVSFYMVKPRLCPSQDQSSTVQSSRPLGFGQVFSYQPAAYRQRTLETGSWPMDEWLHGGVVTGSDPNVLWAVLRWPERTVGRNHRVTTTSGRTYWGCRAVTRTYCGPCSVESSFFWPLW